jgi:hypothetical protein
VTECLGLKSTPSFIGPGSWFPRRSRFAGGGRKRSLRREQPRRRNVRREGQQRRTFVTNRPFGLPLPWLPFLLWLLQASPYQFDVKKWNSELFRARLELSPGSWTCRREGCCRQKKLSIIVCRVGDALAKFVPGGPHWNPRFLPSLWPSAGCLTPRWRAWAPKSMLLYPRFAWPRLPMPREHHCLSK